MRSRPDLTVHLRPGAPTPGTNLEAQITLVSRSVTPIDGIDVHLVGLERSYRRTLLGSDSASKEYDEWRHLDLVGRLPAMVLPPGEHHCSFGFAIPEAAPPTYRSYELGGSVIAYLLDVRVDIPWWPDRTGSYVVQVKPPEASALGSPRSYCTDSHGPKETKLYLEASVESDVVALGGSLRGAVSLANVAHHRVRRVELAFVQTENAHGSVHVSLVSQRRVIVLSSETPADGAPIGFHVRMPADAAPNLSGHFFDVRWFIEIRAVVALGSDVTVTIPITVLPESAPGGPAPRTPLARVPPVGRDRRALLWAESARHFGLANDAETEEMSLAVGDVTLHVTLESRKAGGTALVAAIAWPRLGIDLALTERRWVDAWASGQLTLKDHDVARRFTVRGREEGQVGAFLDDALLHQLLFFDEAAVGDEGATLSTPNPVQSVETLNVAVGRAVLAARAFAEATSRVPPPLAMAAFAVHWRALAATYGGRLVVGDMSLLGASFEGASMDLSTEWTEGAPVGMVVRFPMPLATTPAPLENDLTARVRNRSPVAMEIALEGQALRARLDGTVEDPTSLRPVLEELRQLVRILTGGAGTAPYR